MAINYVNREAENVQNSETGIRFHEENTNLERDPASYKNRINQLYNFRTNIKKLIYRNGFEPSTDYSKFLRLKSKDALSEDVQESNIATSVTKPMCASTLSDPEAAAIEASQFEQEENKAEEEPKTEESAPVRRRRKVRP